MDTEESPCDLEPANLIICSICMKPLTDPKQLPCAHTFCLECLQDFGMMARPGDNILCPACVQTFEVPIGGFGELPTNTYAKLLVELMESSAGKNKDTDMEETGKDSEGPEEGQLVPRAIKTCDICNVDICPSHVDIDPSHVDIDPSHANAATFCRDCNKTFCVRCLAVHSKMPANELHEMVRDKILDPKAVRVFHARKCDRHPLENISYYCYDCDISTCRICIRDSHCEHRIAAAEDVSGMMARRLIASSYELLQVIKNCGTKAVQLQVDMDQAKATIERLENEYPLKEVAGNERLVREIPEEKFDEWMTAARGESLKYQIQMIEEHQEILHRYSERLAELRIKCPRPELVCLVPDLLSLSKDLIERSNDMTEDSIFPGMGFFGSPVRRTRCGLLTLLGANPSTWQCYYFAPQDGRLTKFGNMQDFAPTWTGRESQIILHRDTVYVVGLGQQNKELWSWFTEYRRWLRLADMPYPTTSCGLAAVEKNIYVFGGKKSSSLQACDMIQSFNIETSVWSVLGRLQHAVYGPVCLEYEGQVYIFGGQSNATHTNYIQIYDIESNVCTEANVTLPFTSKLNATVWENSAIFIGKSGCWLYNFRTQIWLNREYFCVKLNVFAMFIEDDQLLCVGGGIAGINIYVKKLPLNDIVQNRKTFGHAQQMPPEFTPLDFVAAAPGTINMM